MLKEIYPMVGTWMLDIYFLLRTAEILAQPQSFKGTKPRLQRIFFVLLVSAVKLATLQYITKEFVVAVSILMVFLTYFLLALYLKKKWLYALFALLFYAATAGAGENLALVAARLADPQFDPYVRSYPEDLIIISIYLCLFSLRQLVTIVLFKKLRRRGGVSYELQGLLITVYFLSNLILHYNFLSIQLVAPPITCLGGLIGALGTMLSGYWLYQDGERRKTEKELLELEQMYALEREKYEKLKEKEEQMAQIRHDYANQMLVLERMQNT